MLSRSPRVLVVAALVTVVTLLVIAGGSARAQTTNPPFTVTAAAGRDASVPGDAITFAITAPEPGRTYIWQFGDGTPPVTGPRVMHAYARVDDFTVRLSAQAGAGSVQASLGSRMVRVTPDFRGAFASDIDGQFTPADLFQMAVVVRAPGLAELSVRTSGAIVADRAARFGLADGDNFLVFDDMRIADERDPIIRDELIRRPAATIPLRGGMFTLALDYTPPSGSQTVTLSFTPEVKDFFQPDKGVAVSYPKISDFAGLPDEGTGINDYYLKGDTDFSHTDDFFVRLLALQWGRRGGAWPDDPQQVSTNIFRTIVALLDDGEPGDFNNDYNLARLFYDGTLSSTSKNGKYICIAEAYLFTGLARTLGIPAREFNNAIGEPSVQRADGEWRVRWWQEAGLELWYNGAWHYFDTWLGFTDRQSYLLKNLIYQSWYAVEQQRAEFFTVKGEPTGMRGHSFNAWPGDPPQWAFLEEVVRPGVVVEGMMNDPTASVTDAPPLDLRTLAVPAAPPAAGIESTPLLPDPPTDITAAP